MGKMHKKDECKLFIERHYFSVPVYRFLPFEQAALQGGGWWWYDVLYFGGVVLSPFQLVGTMLSHGAPGNLGEKFHPARPEASNPYGAGNFASPQPRRRFPRYRVAFWLSFHGMSSLYRRKIVPHRCFVQQDEMFQILSSIFPSFFLKHVAILFEE